MCTVAVGEVAIDDTYHLVGAFAYPDGEGLENANVSLPLCLIGVKRSF